MADPLATRVASTPDRIALLDAETGREWRYEELDATVDSLAGRLAGLGLAEGDHLGLLAETSVEIVRLVHAAWRLGLRIVPMNTGLAAGAIARLADRSDLDALVATPGSASAVAAVEPPVLTVGSEAGGELRPLEGIDPDPPARAVWERADVALLPSTSGTTGEPKLVELTMGNLLASATASAFRLGVSPTDRWLLCLPVYHVGGLSPILRCARYGTTLVVTTGFEREAILEALSTHEITGLSLVPTQLGRLLDEGDGLPDSIRTVLLGGAPARRELIDRCRRLEIPVYPTYGLTETASQVATARPEEAFSRPGTVGQPLLGLEVRVLDEDGTALPAGELGEVVVDGPTVSPGYYDDPEATAEAFGPRGLHTGDVGHVDAEGFLWIHGRADDVIITGGENVQPREVERALRDHPAVADAVVCGLPDPEWGERVVALVVAEGEPPEEAGLREHCREQLPGFMVPKGIAFADAIPRTASGTVDRPAVESMLAGSGA